MRKFVQALIVLPLLVSASLSLSQTVEKVIAIVDDNVVLVSELDTRIQSVIKRYQETGTEIPPLEILTNQLLEQLIMERIQLDLAARLGFNISEEDIFATYESIAASNGMSPEEFAAMLAQEGTTVTQFLRDLRDEITLTELQKAAVDDRIIVTEAEIDSFLNTAEGKFWQSPDYFLGHIQLSLGSTASPEEVLTQQQTADEVYNLLQEGEDFRVLATRYSGGQSAYEGGDLGWRKPAQFPSELAEAIAKTEPGDVTPPVRSSGGIHIFKVYEKRGGDARQMVQQTQAQHILVQPTEIMTPAGARELIFEIHQRLKSGESFEDLARQYSDDVSNALKGGDLGWVYPGQMVSRFEDAMNLTPVGDISDPVETEYGWHVVKVNERKDVDVTDQVMRNQAASLIKNQRYDEELDIWLQEIRNEAFVQIVGGE